MDNDVIYEGTWWNPDKPDHRVLGRFTFSRDSGVELELHGNLHEAKAVRVRSPELPNLLIGVTLRGYFVYVLHGRWGGMSTSSGPNSYRSKVKAQMAFVQKGIGPPCEFKEAEEVKFTELSVDFTHLDQWFGDYWADIHIDSTEDYQSVQMNCHAPDPIKVSLDECDLTFRVGNSQKIKGRKRFEIELEALVGVKFKTAKTVRECYDFIHLIRGFITLGLGAPTYPAQIFGKVADSQNLEFLYQDGIPLRRKQVDGGDALFELTAIRDDLQEYLKNWIAQSESLKPVYDLYFSSRYNPHQYLHSHFLSLIQALETYHRRQYGGQYMDESEYKAKVREALIAAIPDDLDDDFKQSLKTGTLKYAYQYSLRKRLKEIAKILADEIPGIRWLDTREGRNIFVANVADVRNYLTHYDPNSDIDTSSGRLHKLSRKLEMILEICLLKEIGMSSEQINHLIHKSWKYKSIFLLD